MTQHKSIEFNNAGVELLAAGRVKDAHDLFRAGLLSHMEGNDLRAWSCLTSSLEPRKGCVTPNDDLQQEHDMGNMPPQTLQDYETRPEGFVPLIRAGDTMLSSHNIHQQAFAIHQADPSFTEPSAAAIHVFNLGLVHHLMESVSWKAKSCYEVAALLLAINPTFTHSTKSTPTTEDAPQTDIQTSLNEAIMKNLRMCLVECGELDSTLHTSTSAPTAIEPEPE